MPSHRTCGGQGPGGHAATGVVLFALLLAISGASAQPSLPQWQLDASPSLSIGGEGGPGEFLRITGVFKLSNGHVAVVNAGTQEIRIFDGRGEYVTTFGRQGGGPGEFFMPSFAWRIGDTLQVWDGRLLRVTTLLAGPQPRLLHTVQMTARNDREGYSIRGRTSANMWLALTTIAPRGAGPSRLYREQSSIGLIPANGSGTVSWLARLPSALMAVHNPSGDFGPGDWVGYSAFSPTLELTVSAGALWYGDSGSDSLFVAPGTQTHVIRLPIARRTPSPQLLQAKRPGAGQYPKYLPYFERLVPGQSGEVWVEEYTGLNALPTRYLVIGADLKPRARVAVPAGFRIMDVGNAYVLGVHYDEDGVETVRSYALRR